MSEDTDDMLGREIAGNIMFQTIFVLLDKALEAKSPGLDALRASIETRLERFDRSDLKDSELASMARVKSGASARVEEVFTGITSRPKASSL